MKKTPGYDDLLKKRAKLFEKKQELYLKIALVNKALDLERKAFELVCLCGATMRVGDLEVVRREYGGYYSNSN